MIVCVGDSITSGQCLPDGEPAWPALLGCDVIVQANPGDTTRIALERFPAVQELEPDAVILQLGHNDCNRWLTDRGLTRVSPAAFVANFHEMIDRCRTFGAVPYLCSLTPSRKSDQHALDVAHYDRLIREVARRRGVPLIDLRDAFTRHDLGYDPKDLLLGDGIHLSAAGQRRFAASVADHLMAVAA